jgi:hypothetical protein
MKNLRNKFILIVFFFPLFSYTQVTDSLSTTKKPYFFYGDTKHSIAFKGEYSFQGNHYISVGLGFLNPRVLNGGPCATYILGTEGFSINSDLYLGQNNFHIIPKISYEFTFLLFGAKMNVGTITNFKSNQLLISPEIGLSLFGKGYLFYGYNFIENNLFGISNHKVTLGINLVKTKYRK